MHPSETLDLLMPGKLQLLQSKDGYRYSIDTILLARFVRVNPGCRILDLGTGNGVLPLLLARISAAQTLCGVELQQGQAERARRNVVLNNLQDRVTIIQGDVRRIDQLCPAATVDLVVTNPPYRAVASGRIAPDSERAAARHELAGTLKDFIAAANWSLVRGGRFGIVYLAERLQLLLASLTEAGIEPKRIRMVHPYPDASARLVLLEACKGGRPGLEVEKPLVLYLDRTRGRNYSAEVKRMYACDDSVTDKWSPGTSG